MYEGEKQLTEIEKANKLFIYYTRSISVKIHKT